MRFAVALPWWGYALGIRRRARARLARLRARAGQADHRQAASALSALRALTLILLIVILLRPVVMVPPAAANNSLLPILVDVSRSMRLHGRRRAAAPRARPGDRTRSAGAARRPNTESSLLTFGETLAAATDVDRLAATARRSDLSGAHRRSRRAPSPRSASPASSSCRMAAIPRRRKRARAAPSPRRCSPSASAAPTRRAIARSSTSPPASRCCRAHRST